jgi:hypothetical protein
MPMPRLRPLAFALLFALGLTAFACVFGLTALALGGDKPSPPPTAMQRKLAHAQKALEALALNDFDSLGRSATGLIDASRDASFQVLKTKRYELYSDDFRQAAERLQKHAKASNTDAAALAYVDLTLTCVKCHQHVREERVGSLAPAGDIGFGD